MGRKIALRHVDGGFAAMERKMFVEDPKKGEDGSASLLI